MADQAKERRAAKRGALKTAERERVAADAAAWKAGHHGRQLQMLELVGGPGATLPDDDKPSGPGRPVGARTASPLEYRRHILATKGDYLARFAAIANADTLALAKILDCTPLEALQMQQKLGSTAAPYIYTPQRAPIDQQDAQYFAGMLFVAGAAGAAAGVAGPTRPAIDQDMSSTLAALAGRPPDTLDLQAFSVTEAPASEPPSSEQDEEAP